MTGGHPLRVREWARRVERRGERAPRRDARGSAGLLVSAIIGLALAALLAAVTR